ncbi:hypothetical protein [Pedobacter panaciterrae]
MKKTISSLAKMLPGGNSHSYDNVNSSLLKNQVVIHLLIVLCCLLSYFPVFCNKFQNKWDDQWVVINDYTSRGFNVDNIWSILTEYYHGQYAPANQLYYTFLHSLDGYNPLVFHSASLLLHLINSCLVYLLLTRLLTLIFKDDKEKNEFIGYCTGNKLKKYLDQNSPLIKPADIVDDSFYLIKVRFKRN